MSRKRKLRELQMQFKSYLITEEKVYLGEKVGDILTALQQLQNDGGNMGKRHLMRLIVNIVRKIRQVLHGSWSYDEEKYLKVLQKVGVALMKGLDNNEDLIQLISNCADAVNNLSDQIDTPVNNLAAPAGSELEEDDDEEE